jgi:ankyrin repeat protein
MSTPAQELLTAVAGGDADRVAALLTADPQLCNLADRIELRQSVLHHAAERGSLPIVELLLIAGANVDKYDSVGNTALLYAAGAGHLAVVQLLVEHGACQLAKAWNCARGAGHHEIATFLKDRIDQERHQK